MTKLNPLHRGAWLLPTIGMLACLAPAANAQEHWVATWAASPQAPRVVAARPALSTAPGTPAPPTPPVPAFNNQLNNQTVRMVVRTGMGGRRARVQLSNTFGAAALKIGSAHVALRDKESDIVAGTDRQLTFSGKTSFSIPPGADIVSDPVELDLPKLADLAISLYIPDPVTITTTHAGALHTTYISKPGDFTGAASIADATRTQSWYWISAVDVAAPPDAAVIVAYGDSITDGTTSTPDTDSSWPSQFARRLAANKATENITVVNEGIAGNRVLRDGAGISALARFDRDVLAQPGVRWVVFMEGINDIGQGARATGADAVTAEDLIAAHKQLIERAHMHGVKAIGVTLTPFQGAAYFSDEGEAARMALNQWIRTGKAYDAVIDFDAVVQDPANPKQILPAFNIRDHLHPNDAGYKAMAEAIDLGIFTRR